MKKSFLCLALPLLAACASKNDGSGPGTFDVVSKLHPYRMDVRQGNMVTQQMVAQLKPGLTKDQVRFILGTPLVADMFHADRWDYYYRLQTGDGEVSQRHLIVLFEDGKLARLGGDVVAESPGTAAPPKPAGRIIEIKAPEPPKPEDQPAAAESQAPAPSSNP